ncbi:flagellar protein FlaG [Pelosinus sp. sgz500959]|uniref:flagellar protein FlaG n=1 Tax=Pelosinus sp. sgz500959 TaxID=3242472 RepID=UPI003672EE75
MDISALKGKINPVSTPISTPAPTLVSVPAMKSSSEFQVVSTTNKNGSAVKSETPSNENKTEKKPVNVDDVKQMTEAMNHFLQVSNAGMQVTLHEKTQELMVRFVDSKSGQVLKEFPSHEFLDTIANIREYVGLLLDKKI